MLVNSSLIQKLQGEYWFFYVRGWPQLVTHGRTIESESSIIAGVPKSIYQGWGVGWDGSRVGPVRKDLKSEFVAVLVSMLSMLVQVRRGGRGGIGFNKCIHFVFGFKTFNYKAFFSFELRYFIYDDRYDESLTMTIRMDEDEEDLPSSPG